MKALSKITVLSAVAGAMALGLAGPAAAKFPSKPIDFVCATSPGSGAAVWCHLVADHLRKDLKNPVKVQFKSGGSNYEPTSYVAKKPNDGHTLLHISGSFTGYFNLPHFKYDEKDFDILAAMEQHLYAIAVHSDSPWKTYKDWIKAAKKAPNKYAMGSNKIGSIHHRHQELIHKTAGIKVRFVPYKGTGDVVKDVIGKHLIIGFAQPGKWNSHIKAGTARALLLLNGKRLPGPIWGKVPVPSDLGLNYDIPHQFQGFMVRKGTPAEAMKTLKGSLSKLKDTKVYKQYLSKQPHVIPGYDDDTASLNKKFAAGKKSTRKLMIKLGILKAGS
jgi:tripartite-type tricarboxylate transporter receptor subunit TctC